jgi:3-methyladenine DNA glycosylase AlkD
MYHTENVCVGILAALRTELQNSSDEVHRNGIQKFFKEEVPCYGIKSSRVSILAKKYFKLIQPASKDIVFKYCEALWQSGFQEEGLIACQWSACMHKQFSESDLILFEKWIERYISNWATCDTFCNHTVGGLLLKYPQVLPALQTWAVAEGRWLRRAAAVSLIVPARKGIYWQDIAIISNLQLNDRDDMIQKGYGWLLKVASQSHEQEVFDFVMAHRTFMPRTALRYAIEKMTSERKALAMKK